METKVIEIRKREDDYHAQLKNVPEIWGCGESSISAIGDLIVTHPEEFGIEIIGVLTKV